MRPIAISSRCPTGVTHSPSTLLSGARALEVIGGAGPGPDCSDLWAYGEEPIREGIIAASTPQFCFEDCLVRVGYQSVLTSPTVEELICEPVASSSLRFPTNPSRKSECGDRADGHTQIPVLPRCPARTNQTRIHGYGSYEISLRPGVHLRFPHSSEASFTRSHIFAVVAKWDAHGTKTQETAKTHTSSPISGCRKSTGRFSGSPPNA